MKKFSVFLPIILSITFIIGCSNVIGNSESKKGFLLEVNEDQVLFVEGIESNEYEEIKDLSLVELLKLEEVPNLFYLTYNDTANLTKGDNIEVWIKKEVETSLPAMAVAKKINRIE
ncbi:DUF3221 domain-containing protein [Sutcliffiella rhizosphaerae]|uniref:DUF3221 domain-containing protein n=1 Tax=Sutcliffiella rhizosphaerae TaxID=2880967 RepID=A0ABM8YKC6_9BACI|nr:DUF3221 domain-containing protein [Sutcliffiella rhizosphaerae]CAG9620400.1 hypothetical protein BACCIP111883_01168 [Sutcliffiella rhizosphaerae]